VHHFQCDSRCDPQAADQEQFLHRSGDHPGGGLTEGDALHMPAIDVEMMIDEFYAGLDFLSPAEAEPRT
jgi:hypothetical protein